MRPISFKQTLKNVRLRIKLFLFVKFIFPAVNINRLTPRVVRLIPETWVENSPVKISWDPGLLGDDTLTVAILLARFSMKDDDVYFHSTFSLKAKQKNIGESQFTVPKGEGQG